MSGSSAPAPAAPSLEGVRALDLAGEAGALATRILSDLGAEVIMLEPPGGSPLRHRAPFLDDRPDADRGYRHLYLDAGKRSIVVDDNVSPEVLRALAMSAQLLVETPANSEQGAASLANRLVEANPELIRVAITPFGPNAGERAGWRSSDLIAAASGGLLAVSGEATDPPTRGPASPGFSMASLAAAAGAMIALVARVRGNGDPTSRVDVSMQEAVSFAVLQTSNPNTWTWRAEVPRRPAMSSAFRCADGRWAIGGAPARRLPEFIALLDAAGVDHDLDSDSSQQLLRRDRAQWQFQENPLAYAARDLAARMPRDEFLQQIWDLGAAAMPIMDFAEMATTDHYIETGQFRQVHHEALDVDLSFVRSPVDGLALGALPAPAPELGADQALLDQALQAPPVPTPTAAAHRPEEKPLAGIRVLDLCWVLAGPLGTRTLANFGADVIKVESEARPDSLRTQPIPGLRFHPDLPDVLNDANTGKRSLLLDLTTEAGRDLLLELVAQSDVIADNFRAGSLARMGFPYERLREANPEIVVAHMPGPGSTGPWSDRRTLGPHLLAASGLNYLTGFEGRPPRNMGVAYPDFTSPLLMVAQVLAALYRRESTGEGCEIDLSQLSATISLLGADWMRYSRTGEQPPRPGNRDANYSPHGVFPTHGEDEWCAIAVEDDGQWRRLAELIGAPGLGDDSRFSTHEARKTNEDALEAIIGAWTASQDRWELAAAVQAAGVAAAPVEDLRDMLEGDTVMAEHYQRVRQPSDPDLEIVIDRDPIWISGHERELTRAPMRGEHSEYVVREMLGYSREEFDALVVAGAIF
jgi:crotonobetainyl-CoA:carnitine CoA-transferase CaiB-like acyl-CoA transferase